MKQCKNPRCRALIPDGDDNYCKDCRHFLEWRETTRGVKR